MCTAPSPSASAGYAFPAFTGYVVDRAGVIGQSERRQLTKRLGRVERRTGHQVAVVTVTTLGGHAIEPYATALANRWGVGRCGYNDGVLLLVAPRERKVRIAVGYGLERTLTNAEASEIVERRILPAFRAGHMEQGIAAGVDGVLGEIAPGGEGQ